jgi:cephalosporin-C deacetylase-like acetyl esterase
MRFLPYSFILFLLCTASNIFSQDVIIEIPKAETENSFLLDGAKSSSFWARSKILPALQLEEAAAASDEQCQIEVVENNGWVIFGVTIKEPKNIIVTESMHNEAQWFDDNITFEFMDGDKLSIQTNSLGALAISIKDKLSMAPITQEKIKVCARINEATWRSEIAIHKSLLGDDLSKLDCHITRQRQHRGFEAFQTSSIKLFLQASKLLPDTKGLFALEKQTFENLTVFNGSYRNTLPEKISDWDSISSQELTLYTGNNAADPDFQKTKVKLAVNNYDITILVDCDEKNLEELFKDEKSIANDSLEIYLTPEGFRYFQVAITPDGKMQAHVGLTGGRRVRSMYVPASAKSSIVKGTKSWSLQYKISIKDVLDFAGAPSSYTPSAFPWQFQVIRNRGGLKSQGQKAQESQLAINNSATAHCPIRFAKILFSTSQTINNAPAKITVEPTLSKEEVDEKNGRTELLRTWVKDKQKGMHAVVQEKLNAIQSLDEWVSFKNEMIKNILISLFPNSAGTLPKKIDTKATCVYTIEKDDVVIKGVIFRSRKNIPVTGTLYLPKDYATRKNMPAMIMIPAHHTSRNCNDIYCLAKNLTDQGCLAISIDTLGSGERGIAARWNHKNHQRNLIGNQLTLAGEEITGWAITDIISTVDYLLERKDVDHEKIAVIGGVAGGGDIASLSGALDERISVTIPFNFSNNQPITGWYDLTRSFPLSHYYGMTAWIISALVAPRQLIDAQEFAWDENRIKEFDHFKKIYGYFDASENLDFAHGDKNTHASSFLPLHRVGVYKILNKWWDLHLPETIPEEKKLSLQDGHLEVTPFKEAKSFVNKYFHRTAKEVTDASVFTEPNFLAEKIAATQRKKFQSSCRKGDYAAKALNAVFTDTEAFDTEAVSKAMNADKTIETIQIPLEDKLSNERQFFSAITLHIGTSINEKKPLVICLSQEGKLVFAEKRLAEINSFVAKGYSVAVVDVRGVGQTEATSFRLPESDTASLGIDLWQMHDSLLEKRIKDTKTIIKALASRPDISAEDITLWGEGFSEPNGKEGDIFKFEETGFRQAGPGSKRLCEPLGMNLAIFTPLLLDSDYTIKRVIARGGLISYESILKDFYYYLPSDIFVPGLLTKFDIPDIISALTDRGIKLYLEDVRDAKNRVISEDTLNATYHYKVEYYQSNVSSNIVDEINSREPEFDLSEKDEEILGE